MIGKIVPRWTLVIAAFVFISMIVFPATAGAESTYIVQPGDTLFGIAKRFSSSLEAIAAANGIADLNLILIGQRLTVPNGDAAVEGSVQANPASEHASATAAAGPGSVLANRRLLTYYGNPFDGRMGIMGALSPQELVDALNRRAATYQELSDKPVQPAIHFIVTVAQAGPGEDGKYRLRMPMSLVTEYSELAAKNGMLIFLDIQVGHSTVQEELEPWIPLLSQPHVHLALDPEFDMWAGQLPGEQIGHMTADEVNYSVQVLANLVSQYDLPNKVLILHQFAALMLPDKANIRTNPLVDIVTDMDGFGSQALKRKHYEWYVHDELIQFAGMKLFLTQDTPLFTAEEVMNLDPVPDVIIYQ